MILIDKLNGFYFDVADYIIIINIIDEIGLHGRWKKISLFFKAPNLIESTIDLFRIPFGNEKYLNKLKSEIIEFIKHNQEILDIDELRMTFLAGQHDED